MALNPFFLQGSPGEQRLVQNLINEQLQIYGVEVTYIPRKFVNKQSIIEEVQSSKFDDNFLIEAYVNTYEAYSGAGDIMTKFGVSLRDEITLTISKERFEDFIAPFLKMYFTALLKRQWGQNLIKFRGVKLPGGLELNGREIYDDGQRELDAIKQKMQLEYELPPLDFIG